LVLDPFSGSATTLAVAKKLGRSFVGFDVSEEYIERGRERLKSIHIGDPLDGAPEPSSSAPPTPKGAIAAIRKGHKSKGKLGQSPETAGLTAEPSKSGIEGVIAETLIQAYSNARDGYSLDRVVADPDLNTRLSHECQRVGLAGEPRIWNRMLFDLRKNGRLSHLKTSKRTSFSQAELDHYLFASEIALQQMINQGIESLDEVLCDPTVAREFDSVAAQLAPGYSPLQYRWGALKLRKEAKDAREHAQRFKSLLKRETGPGRFGPRFSTLNANWERIPNSPGVYMLTGSKKDQILYVGESIDLRTRLQDKFAHQQQRSFWLERSPDSEEIFACTFKVEGLRRTLAAYQAILIEKHRPPLNLQDWSAA
jgi:hypothetical protein